MEQPEGNRQVVENFLTAYQNLEGLTYGEKRRNLFKLLINFKTSDELVKIQVIRSLKEDSHLQKVFKIETLISFKLSAELFEVLATELSDITRKIYKQQWLFQEPFERISSFSIVKEFLPRFSVVNRHRILIALSKYHKNENKIDEVFDDLLHDYGLDTARLVLTGCSVNKIGFAVKNMEVQLEQKQLLSVFTKSPSLFLYIVKDAQKLGRRQAKKIYKCLVQIDLKTCLEVGKKNDIRFGKRCTRKLLPIYKSQMIMSPKDYFRYLHRRILEKFFSEDDLRLALRNSFPKKFTDYRGQFAVSDVLRLFPGNKFYHAYSEAYKEVYHVNLWDNVDHMDEDMVEMVIDDEEREKWIEYKIKEGVSDTRYIHCYALPKSIEMIKTKLNFTSTYKVTQILMEKLIDTCKFHYDKNPEIVKNILLDVLKYICKRHRNNDNINSFADHFSYSFDLSNLTQEHWKYINEILEVIKVKNMYFSRGLSIQSAYIEFMWKNNIPIEDYISKYVADDFQNYILYFHSVDRSLQKALISLFLNIDPIETVEKQHKLTQQDRELLVWIIEWNSDNHNESIDISKYPRLLNSLETILDDRNRSVENMFKGSLCTKESTNIKDHLTEIYFKKYLNKVRPTSIHIILWFLKNDPSSLAQHADDFLKFIYSRPTKRKRHYKYQDLRKNDLAPVISYILKLPDHNFQDKLVSFGLKNYINDGNEEDMDLNHSLNIMARFMGPQDYVDLVKKHVTPIDRMKVDEEVEYNELLIGNAVIRSLIRCRSTLVLPLLIQRGFDDHFSVTLNTLNYYFYHTSVNFLRAFSIKLVEECPVGRSVVFSLTCRYGTVEDVINIYRTTLNVVDVANKKKIFRKTLLYLRKNFSDELFYVLSNQFKDLKNSDRRVLKILKKMQSTPLSFRVKLLDFVLANCKCSNEISLLPDIVKLLMNSISSEVNKMSCEYKVKLLVSIISHFKYQESECSINQSINELLEKMDDAFLVDVPNEVCVSFIDHFLFTKQTFITTNRIYKFTIHYLFHSESDFPVNFDIIFDKIVTFQSEESQDFVSRMKTRQKIALFFSIISIHMKHLRTDMIRIFHDKLLSFYHITEIFHLIFFVRALIIRKESNNVRTISENLYNLVEEVYSNYGANLVKLLANSVKKIFKDDVDSNEMLYSLCYTLYEVNSCPLNCLFILSLLPSIEPVSKIDSEKFMRLLFSLNQNTDPEVKVQLGLFMREY